MDITAFNVTITPIIAIIIGLILAFAGYRLKRIAMSIIWFVIGYSIMGQFAPNLIEDPFWQMILRIAAGAILSMIGLSIEKLAVSLTTGVVVTWFIIQHFGPVTSWVLPCVAIAIGVVAGTIAVWAMKPAVIVFTGIEGANLLATNILALITNILALIPAEILGKLPFDNALLFTIVFVIIAVVGITSQWQSTRNME